MYRYLDHTADLLIEACGRDYASAIEDLAKGMTDAMVYLDSIKPEIEVTIDIQGVDLEDLIQQALSEILYIFDADKMVFSDFKFEVDLNKNTLHGVCRGERYDPEKHGMKLEIKAVTYHMMKIEKKEEDVCIRVLFDI